MNPKAKYIEFQGVTLYTEAFGSEDNPAVVLNAGSDQQCICWPDAFCRALAKDFYVIRYDYRDCGLSSTFDTQQNPYDLLDLANDVLKILQAYDISAAHQFGFSMGGAVAQLLAAHHSDVVLSLLLIGTSTTFQPGFDAFEGVHIPGRLSPPNPDYVAWVTRPMTPNPTAEMQLEAAVESLFFLDGRQANFERDFFTEQAKLAATRSSSQTAVENHPRAMKKSYSDHHRAAEKIQVPTLVIHGDCDPVFPIDHGDALHHRIANSALIVFPKLGHALSPNKMLPLLDEIIPFLQQHHHQHYIAKI